jgi:hypothetical protein
VRCRHLIFWLESQRGGLLPYCKIGAKSEGNNRPGPLVSVRDQVSHPYKTTGRIMVLCILTFTFLDSRREDKRLWTEWQHTFPEFSLLLISSCMQFWSVSVVPKYLNFATSSKKFQKCLFKYNHYQREREGYLFEIKYRVPRMKQLAWFNNSNVTL